MAVAVCVVLVVLTIRACSSSPSGGSSSGGSGGYTSPGPGLTNPPTPTPTPTPADMFLEGRTLLGHVRSRRDPDFARGFDLVSRAADDGHLPAMDYLADFYEGAHDPYLANLWRRRANAARAQHGYRDDE
jgi:hypothetical protein